MLESQLCVTQKQHCVTQNWILRVLFLTELEFSRGVVGMTSNEGYFHEQISVGESPWRQET